MGEKSVDKIKEDLLKTKVDNISINKELQNSFLEYAMSVIVARAIPDARDGLKPVHRRVLYAAYGLGLSSDKPHKKSARIVGEVIGKYHPHGDTAAYETMVRMAQDFSMRYQLIDGHGNFGTTDDGAAAMRYTEARLSKVADIILQDIDKDTVDYVDNYDGSETEPTVLTAIFPNLLANGSSGIAVGMATNIPPHNLSELVAAIKLIAKDPEVTVDAIKEVLKGPDFPTGAEVIGLDGIDAYFRTGRGSISVRSKIEIKYNDNGKSIIIVKELPYMVGKKDLIDRITELVKTKVIEGISDLQDYSNRNGTRIEIETKKDVIPEVLLNQLYKQTSLQTSFPVNMLALVNGEPKLLNIIDSLKIYLDHQISVLVRKLKNELKNAKAREHILVGLHIATGNIDEVIAIIKAASDNNDATTKLMAKFSLDEIQCKAILDMKLRSLSGLERKKIEEELINIRNRIDEINDILVKKERQLELVIQALEEIDRKFGDARRTVIRTDITSDIDDEDLIPKEDILITMSSRGYLKRLPVDTYRVQNRGGVGVIGLQTQQDDDVEKIVSANTHTDLLLFSNFGKIYRIRGHRVPMGSRTSKGIPAINIVNIEKDERIITILPIEDYSVGSLFFATINGRVKKTLLTEFQNINRSGKIAISLNDDDKLFNVIKILPNEEVYIGADNGNMVRFAEDQVRAMGRTAAGVGGIDLEANQKVVGLSCSSTGDKILSVGCKGVGKLSPKDEYRLTKRNAKGVRTLKVNAKTGKLMFVSAVRGDEDALMITTSGKIIRFSLKTINVIGRSTSGVRLMRVDDDEKLQAITMFNAGEFGGEYTQGNEITAEKLEEDDKAPSDNNEN
ncbi:MAG: DNA topoisomerase (ATP-hydrolyzing) subunit A [Mycoplasmataceae bacterium]|jgi:DNA gyrase subunit A|nr:DNA topoisomerase (ATP-hydrolyzing) subunit A [Mycoplasmataceae bacterium]